MPISAVLAQRCIALYIGPGPGLTLDQLMAISCLTSLQSLDIQLPEDNHMGFIPS